MPRHFEFKSKTSNKFWDVEVKAKTVKVRYGKIGTDGQTIAKALDTAAEAKAHAEKKIAEKLKEGYVEGTGGADRTARQSRSAAPPAEPDASALIVKSWEAWCRPAGRHGFSRLSTKAVVVFKGNHPAHSARLEWVLTDAAGLPRQTQVVSTHKDVDDGGELVLATSDDMIDDTGAPASSSLVRGQVTLFAGPRSQLIAATLPGAEPIGGSVPFDATTGLEITGWRCENCGPDEEGVSYRLWVVVRNAGHSDLAAVTLRLQVRTRRGDLLSTENGEVWLLGGGPVVEKNLTVGEWCYVEAPFGVGKNTPARRGATLEVVGIACRRPVLVDLGAIAPAAEAAASKGKSTRAKRKLATFRFTRQMTFRLGELELKGFCAHLGLESPGDLQRLADSVSSGWRDDENDAAYRAVDAAMLPHLVGWVFFDNFSQPELIFSDPEPVSANLGTPDKVLKSSRILYFAVWNREDDSPGKSVEIAVETQCRLGVVAGVDVAHPDAYEDTDISDEFRECRNMFNFWVDGFEYDDDEGLDHEWSAVLE